MVRAHDNIPEDQIIVITVAMGSPADGFAANDVSSQRRPVDEVVTFTE